MKTIKTSFSLFFFLCIFFITSICFAEFESYPFGEIKKDEIINKYFENIDLDNIEGFWIATPGNKEFAIIKNTSNFYPDYEYIGIEAKYKKIDKFKPGDLRFIMKSTAADTIFAGYWIGLRKSIWGHENYRKRSFPASFEFNNSNIIRVFGEDFGNIILVRSDELNKISKKVQSFSSGTGFFITKNLIATNHHVVEDGKEFSIILSTGQEIPVTVVVQDPANDLAILKVSSFVNVVPLKMGNIKSVRPGEKVYTIGHPLSGDLGKEARVSEGIVNSLTGVKGDIREFQISIPIQPGNSGGPMFNSRGEVVGITTSGFKPGAAQNVNFAIKIDYLYLLTNSLSEEVNLDFSGNKQELNAKQIMDNYVNSVVLVDVKK